VRLPVEADGDDHELYHVVEALVATVPVFEIELGEELGEAAVEGGVRLVVFAVE
jgi:hypothetical protein